MENHLQLMNKGILFRLDWLLILLYTALVIFGFFNIYSTTYQADVSSIFDLSLPIGKQLWFWLLSLVMITFLMAVRAKFIQQFAQIIYGISIVLLVGLFLFGKTISGATSWYVLGGLSFQPAEFAKMSTALMLGAYLNRFQTNLKQSKSQLIAFGIIALPALLIVVQPDPGSALVFGGLIFMLFREDLNLTYLYLLLSAGIIFILSLLYQFEATSLFLSFLVFLVYFLIKRIRPKIKIYPFLGVLILSIGFSYSVDYIFNEVFEQRHRDRFNIVLGKTVDNQGIGYNINQSKIAIGSGGLQGKGFLQGSQTKGNFVPEQHTDYIFSTVGEEWGFLGCSFIVLAFSGIIIRILIRAEKQTNSFRRAYAYGVAGIFFVHFFVNIGMSLGLVPTVGIPLPFISYGGSNLLFFTLLLFVHLNFDANRLSIW